MESGLVSIRLLPSELVAFVCDCLNSMMNFESDWFLSNQFEPSLLFYDDDKKKKEKGKRKKKEMEDGRRLNLWSF